MSTYMRGSQIGGVFVHTSLVAAEPDVAASSLGSLLSGAVVSGIPVHESVVVDNPTLVGLLPNVMQGVLVGGLISHITATASSLTGLSILELPSKLVYVIGESLDLTGLVVQGDGVEVIIPHEYLTVTGFDSSSTGSREVFLSYMDFEVVFTVTIEAAYLTISPPSGSYSASGGTGFVTVSSNVAWVATSDSAWIVLGAITNSVAYTVSSNSGGSRSGVISITGGGITRTFSVSQAAFVGVLTITPAANLSSGSGLYNVAVTANVSWTSFSTAPDWLTIIGGGSGSSNNTLSYYVTGNLYAWPRNGSITVTGGGLEASCVVTQAAAEASLEISSYPNLYPLSGAATNQSMGIASNTDWTASSDQSWLTINSYTGSLDGTIIYSITANTVTSTRSAVITITDGSIVRTVTITQAAADASLWVDLTASVGAGGGSQSLAVTSNIAWSSISSQSWLTITNGSGSNNGSVTYFVDPNTAPSSRQAMITVSGSGLNVGCTVTQAAMPATPEGYFTFDAGLKSITGYNVAGGLNVIVPTTIGGVEVQQIGTNGLAWKGLTSLVLPSGLKTLRTDSLAGNSFTSLVIPVGVTTIQDYAVEQCSLTSITIPSTVTYLGYGAFQSNQIATVVLPSNLTTIADYTFSGSPVTRITLGASVWIASGAFGLYSAAFENAYVNTYGSQAGTYEWNGSAWQKL